MKYIVLIMITLIVISCDKTETSSTQSKTITVYISSGAIQCESTGRTPSETAQVLKNNGVNVSKTTCGYIAGLAIAAQCGIGDSNINIHEIQDKNIQTARSLGYETTESLPFGYVETC